MSLCIDDLILADGDQSFCAAVPGADLNFVVPGRVFIHMYQHPDQYPYPVESFFVGIIKAKVPGMVECSDLKEVADRHKRSTIVGIRLVPVYAVGIGPD